MEEIKDKKTVKIPIFFLLMLAVITVLLIFVFFSKNNKSLYMKKSTEKGNITTDNTQAQNDTNTITYTAANGESYEIIGEINIPSLNINYPILSTTSDELLKISVTKYWGANPNEVGNMVVVGHNYRSDKFFSKLPEMQNGAIVEITDVNKNKLDYVVYNVMTIDPYDNSCTSQLTDGHTEITLITCTDDNQQRIVVKARAN